MGKAAKAKRARKFVMLHGLRPQKRRALMRLEQRLDAEGRAGLQAALERDLRYGKLPKEQTHLAQFLASRGM